MQLRRKLLPLACLCAVAALAVPAAANAKTSKFTFSGQTFVEADGAVVTTDGVIQASSKITGKGGEFTNCGYFTAAGEYLGQFQSAEFASADAEAVREFCLGHFAERSV